MTRLARYLDTLPKFDADFLDFAEVPSDGDQPGDAVGPYRLLRELGSGGMGVVWLAERTDGLINRPVALKLPHGAWNRAGLAERMAREREILATLSHPHIAHLYDAGVTAGGQPYLAIEYVEGRASMCIAASSISMSTARLRLFAQVGRGGRVCARQAGRAPRHQAREHPGHAGGQVRLLDFGIAKLLDDGQANETPIHRAVRPRTDARLRVAGTDRGRTAHRRVGRLFARRGAVRAARRAAAVQAAARLTRRNSR